MSRLESGDPHFYVDLEGLGVPLQGEVSRDEEGNLQADHLRHPWESLSTGFTPMAFKVFHQTLGKRLEPGIELKASPAKLLQGHNVFGPTSIRSGGEVMLKWLAGSYPKLFSMLDIPATIVYGMDCTYSSRLSDERTAYQVIDSLTNVSNGQTKSGKGDNYASSAYFGSKKTRLKRLKAYLKHLEYQNQLEEMKRAGRSNLGVRRALNVMSDPRLIEWTKYLLRMEATVLHRWMARRNIPTNLSELCVYQERLEAEGRCLIQECWKAVTKDLFAAFEGVEMKVINDDKVYEALLEKFTKPGKVRHTKERIEAGVLLPSISVQGKPSTAYAKALFRTYLSIKDYGWKHTKEALSNGAFYRHLDDLATVGLCKAVLQKLNENDRKSNVVPLLRFVEVDFSAQRPDWYVEPTPEAA